MTTKRFLITADGSHTIYIPELHETYHSLHGAIQESDYVFIKQGLQFFLEKGQTMSATVFEVGFGTGLNALLSALYARKYGWKVKYQSIEAYPLDKTEIERLNYIKMFDQTDARGVFDKLHVCSWEEWQDISTNFKLCKVNKMLQEFSITEKVDVCFFDAFAPSKQPEMWTKDILEKIYSCLNFTGVFVTYCAKGQLKRDLRMIGFQVETLPGPPGKKEMVRAIKM